MWRFREFGGLGASVDRLRSVDTRIETTMAGQIPDFRDLFTYSVRKKTICIDFRGAKPNCTTHDWAVFLHDDLKISPKVVESVSYHMLMQTVTVGFVDDPSYQEHLVKMQEGVLWTSQKVKVYGWSVGEETTTIRIQNVPDEIDLSVIRTLMMEYGVVLNCVRSYHRDPLLAGIKDGNVNLRMKLYPDKVVPSNIVYSVPGEEHTELWPVRYKLSQKICYRCSGRGHIAAFCKKERKMPDYTARTWAKVCGKSTTLTPVRVISPTGDKGEKEKENEQEKEQETVQEKEKKNGQEKETLQKKVGVKRKDLQEKEEKKGNKEKKGKKGEKVSPAQDMTKRPDEPVESAGEDRDMSQETHPDDPADLSSMEEVVGGSGPLPIPEDWCGSPSENITTRFAPQTLHF